MMRIGKHLRLPLCVLGIVLSAGSTGAADSMTKEYAIKAALVYNFARFTEWPDQAFEADPGVLRIAYCGDQHLGEAFESVVGRKIGQNRIEIRYVAEPEDVIGCHLLFLAETERKDLPQIMIAAGQEPILLIGEMNGFLESGGIVNLHLVHNKIRFAVNLDHARAHHLQISSQLLMLASSVIETEGATE